MPICVYRFFLLLFLLLPGIASAQAINVIVGGAVYSDYSRIIFKAPATGTFQASINGNRLQITLASPIQPNFHEMLRALNAQVSSASSEAGGRNIIIKLRNPEVSLRKFRGANFFGVDLIPLKKTETTANETPAPEKVAPKEEAKKPETKKADAKKPAPKPKAKQKPKAPIKPIKEKPLSKPEKKTEAKTEPAKKHVTPETEVLTPLQSSEAAPKELRIPPKKPIALFTVPFDTIASAAIFVRDEHLWMVFDKYTQVALRDLPKEYLLDGKQIPDRQDTILKFTLSPEAVKNADWLWATKEKNDWVLNYGKVPDQKSVIIMTPEQTQDNTIKLIVKYAAEPLPMLDPEIGDALFIVPVRDPGNRVQPGRNFIQFDALPTVQGVALVRRSDAPNYKVSREGITITSDQKLYTAPVVESKPAVEAEMPKPELEKKTMYPFAHQTDPNKFMPIYYQYLKDLQAAPDGGRSPIHLEMAEHYFLNEYYAEALGLLRDILVDDPAFAAKSDIKPMIAGSLFMMGRYDQAEDAFGNILENKILPQYEEEEKLWRWASAKMLSKQNMITLEPMKGFDVAAALNKYIPSYPYPLRRRLMLIYAEDLIDDSRIGQARNLFKEIQLMQPTTYQKEMMDFLEARALLIEKKDDAGRAKLAEVLKNSTNGQVHLMALLENTQLDLAAGKITLPQAIEALEKGHVEWRGDGVEFTLLQRLGRYYIDNKQYTEGLRAWRELVTQFSGTTDALKVASDMSDEFVKLFDTNGAAYKEPPLQALSTFFEFNELTPVGAQGDRISRLLADYLQSVDLLENAAAILTHQVRFRSQGKERAELAAKLIDIHLSNNRPDLAADVLKAMAGEKIPDNLKSKYQLLRAEILLQQGKYPEALKELENETTQEARDYKMAIFWHEKEWEKFISILEPEMKARAEKLDTLTPNEEERALRLAVAYSKLRRRDELKWLKEAYGKRIKNKDIGDAFDFVASSNEPVDHEALDSSLELNKFRSFIKEYRLPEPPPAPEPEPAKADDKAAPADTKNLEGADATKADAKAAAPEAAKEESKKPEEKKEAPKEEKKE